MRIKHRDLRLGVVKVVPQVLDDLYHLAQLVAPKDRVGAVTWRTPELTDDVERRGKMEKKRMFLTVEVADVEFHEFSDRLRIHGVIAEGPQDLGSHHTINVEADGKGDLTITKPDGWKRHHLERLERAEKEASQPNLFILAVEEDEATFAEVRAYGVREVATVRTAGRGKMYIDKGGQRSKGDDFMEEVLDLITQTRSPGQPLIVVGPGWTRERVVERLRARDAAQGKGVLTEGTGQAGMVGVHEAVRRGVVDRIVKDHAVARDSALFERLLAEIAKGSGLAAYGAQEIEQALGMGAVETLLVTDRAIREHKVDALLAAADQAATEVHVMSEAHEAGERLAAFGGVAGILRFAVSG